MTSGDNATSSAAAVEGLGIRPTCFDPDVPAIGPSEFMECCSECCDMGVPLRIAPGESHQHTYAPHPLALLRARRERPRGHGASEQRDELAPLHPITSSDSNCRELSTSIPSALAVCRLMTNSNLVDCTTGRSALFAPLRI